MVFIQTCLIAIAFFCKLSAESDQQVLFEAMHILAPQATAFSLIPIDAALTNKAYKIEGEVSYFAKFSIGEPTLIGSSLEQEYIILNLLAGTNLTAKPFYYDAAKQLLITQFIDGSPDILNLKDPNALSAVCQQLKILHRQDVQFPRLCCPYAQIRILMRNAQQRNIPIPAKFMENLLNKGECWQESAYHNHAKVPCHLDLHSRNLIAKDGHIWLIDWEYAGQSDPYYDLAVLASAEWLNDAEMEKLLDIYEGGPVSDQLKDHFWKMRILADAKWSLWCYIQAVVSPLDFPFKQHGDEYFAQCSRRFMAKQQAAPTR